MRRIRSRKRRQRRYGHDSSASGRRSKDATMKCGQKSLEKAAQVAATRREAVDAAREPQHLARPLRLELEESVGEEAEEEAAIGVTTAMDAMIVVNLETIKDPKRTSRLEARV